MVLLTPMGEVEGAGLEALAESLSNVFGPPVRIGDRLPLPQGAWERRRSQYLASALLALVPSPAPGNRALGVVDVDIYARGLNFVFGQADVAGRRAIVSLRRLRPEAYGLPRDEIRFAERALKEAVHELGHTYGCGHCPRPGCVMHFSNSLRDTDIKGWDFCSRCRRQVRQQS